MSVSCLVLTAGLGTRLDPLTRIVAKPAVPLGDRTLVEHVLGWLSRAGVRDAVLNLHHRPETITRVVGDGRHLGMRVRYSWEQPVLGSAGGPRRALPLLPDPFLIVNGDTLCDVDVASLLAFHKETGADVTLAVVPNREAGRYNGVVVGEDGVVTGFVPRGQSSGPWHFVGVQVASARAFAGLADGVPSETVHGLYREMIDRTPGRLRAWRTDAPFVDVGTPADYLRAVAVVAGEPERGVIVWPDAVVDAGADLEDCIVAGPVRVPHGVRARRAVIVPEDIVHAGDTFESRDGLAIFRF